jgi:hypothetical protein
MDPEAVGDAKQRAAKDEPMVYCPVCGLRLSEQKCKLVCERCGYYMSCADYY